jgi:hypothetical protein
MIAASVAHLIVFFTSSGGFYHHVLCPAMPAGRSTRAGGLPHGRVQGCSEVDDEGTAHER